MNTKATCRCKSYNHPELGGENDEIILPSPPQITDKPNGICVDACIVTAIQMLWSHGVVTLGCCCGHGRDKPSVVIGQDEDPKRTAGLLCRFDDRSWDVFQWQLVEASGARLADIAFDFPPPLVNNPDLFGFYWMRGDTHEVVSKLPIPWWRWLLMCLPWGEHPHVQLANKLGLPIE